jgi:hypothetical protein
MILYMILYTIYNYNINNKYNNIQYYMCRLSKVQTDLYSVQGEVASGLIVELNIPIDLIGMVIGKKVLRDIK